MKFWRKAYVRIFVSSYKKKKKKKQKKNIRVAYLPPLVHIYYSFFLYISHYSSYYYYWNSLYLNSSSLSLFLVRYVRLSLYACGVHTDMVFVKAFSIQKISLWEFWIVALYNIKAFGAILSNITRLAYFSSLIDKYMRSTLLDISYYSIIVRYVT